MFDKHKIKAVILAGGRDFGRCPIASRLPTALWNVLGKSVLEHLLAHLANEGIKQVTICAHSDTLLLAESIQTDNHLEVNFLHEELPAGSAGSIRDAAVGETDFLLIAFSASIVSPPKIDTLISAHQEGGAHLTLMFNPYSSEGKSRGEAADIYICNPNVLEYIPKEGYFDIKECLIPELLHAGKHVHRALLANHAGNFRDRQGYLYAIANYLENASELNEDLQLCRRTESQSLWKGGSANIDPAARIYGPVAILDGAHISSDTVIVGPAIIGRKVSIGEASTVVNSVLWDGAKVGPNCQVQQCVVDYNAAVRSKTIVEECSIPFKTEGYVNSALISVSNTASDLYYLLRLQLAEIKQKTQNWGKYRKIKVTPWFGVGIILAAFLWSYWLGLRNLWDLWQRSDEYSSGLLVPFLAVYILWTKRHDIAQCRIRPSVWGLFAFIAAQAVRLFGLFFMYGSAERLSIALSVASLVLLIFGWQLFWKVSTTLLFLCLMLPWPNRVQAAVTLPLQRWATSSAVFLLEVIGYEVVQEGNIIHIGSVTVAVAEVCNGLRMIMAFFVISGLVVLLVKRAWWEKLFILASSLPIALLCNTVRLTVTALAFTVISGEYWEKIFHDFGGYAMMPLAVVIVVAELWLLAKLFAFPTKEEAVIVARRK